MTHQHLRKTLAAWLALPLLSASGCIGTDETEPMDGWQAHPEVQEGDVMEIRGVHVLVPEPGSGVFAEVIRVDGTMETLNVDTLPDGMVIERIADPAVDADSSAATSGTAACSDRAYQLTGYRWNETLHWRFRAGTTPSYLDKADVELALRQGTASITQSRNDCGLADMVSAKQRYDGRTSRGPNILADGTCSARDGHNVVAFGALPDGILAIACTWYSQGVALEADIRFNKGDYHWYTAKPAGCQNRFDIRSVMTHERGHSFGLGHVSEASHPTLTMSESIAPCNNTARTLGRGDVRGLRALY